MIPRKTNDDNSMLPKTLLPYEVAATIQGIRDTLASDPETGIEQLKYLLLVVIDLLADNDMLREGQE